jgi:DNA-binding transcriptional MocR family regulator
MGEGLDGGVNVVQASLLGDGTTASKTARRDAGHPIPEASSSPSPVRRARGSTGRDDRERWLPRRSAPPLGAAAQREFPGRPRDGARRLRRAGAARPHSAKARSGFYVRLRPTDSRGAEGSISTLLAAKDEPTAIPLLIATGHDPDVLALDTAAPHVSLTPLAEFRSVFARAIRRHSADAAAYTFPPGHPALRQAIARRLVHAGCSIAPDDIVVTNGATEALLLALRAVTKAGDTVAVEFPTYYGILHAMGNLGLRALEIPTDPRTGVSVEALGRAITRRRVAACFLVPNFSNPLGSRVPPHRLEAIVELLGEAGVPLIEDDANGELGFSTTRPHAAKSHDRRGRVMLCGTVTKTLAPGCRIGWIVPGAHRDRVMDLQWTNTIGPSSPSQLAVAEYFTTSACDRHLRALRTIVTRNMDRFTKAIVGHFPPGTAVSRPEGGLVLWVRLPRGVSALHLHRAALAERIAIMPGTLFSPRPIFDDHVRICCAVPWSSRVEEAIAKLGRLCEGA